MIKELKRARQKMLDIFKGSKIKDIEDGRLSIKQLVQLVLGNDCVEKKVEEKLGLTFNAYTFKKQGVRVHVLTKGKEDGFILEVDVSEDNEKMLQYRSYLEEEGEKKIVLLSERVKNLLF